MLPLSLISSTLSMGSGVIGQLMRMSKTLMASKFLRQYLLTLAHLTGIKALLTTMNTLTFSGNALIIDLSSFRGYSEPQIMNGLMQSSIKLVINLAVRLYWSLKVSIKEHLVPLFQSIGIKISIQIIKKTPALLFSNQIRGLYTELKMKIKAMLSINIIHKFA